MVVIQIKSSDADTFLYETTCDTPSDTLVREIVRVWNMRLRLGQLCGALRDMAKYGPMKHPNKAGLDEIGEKYNSEVVDKGPHYLADPTGNRTGNGVGPQLSETVERVVLDTDSVLSSVRKNQFLLYGCSRLISSVTLAFFPLVALFNVL
jgi:cilia- and flagella-associated protein 298